MSSKEEIPEQTRVGPILAMLGLLAIYCYLFTQSYHDLGLPGPVELAETLGLDLESVFDDDGNVDSNLWIAKSNRRVDPYSNDDERLILFGAIAGAFLCCYFLPRPWRKGAMVVWFLVAFLPLYGLPATAGFLAAHLLIFLCFHPLSPQRTAASLGLGALSTVAALQFTSIAVENQILLAAGMSFSTWSLWRWVLPGFFRRQRPPAVLRAALVHSPLFFGCCGALTHGLNGQEWTLPLGVLLVAWQWERLLVYNADYNDGRVPEELPLCSYLAVFLTPAAVTNWTYSPYVGQAYAYQEERYLKKDKNRLVWAGLQLLALALFYLLLGEWLVWQVVGVLEDHLGIQAYPWTTSLIAGYMKGENVTQGSVLATTILYQFRVLMVFGAVTHFRVGVWRTLGYDMEPQYDKPWLATNLVTFWRRFAFHYREFLVRVFYYPIFFRCFKKHPQVRIFFATLLATSVGNHLWGHIPDRLYDRGMTMNNLVMILRAWPYYLLLGLGIAVTQVYLLRRKRKRKPWTRGPRIALDVLAAYATIQYFCLIHLFARPPADGGWRDTANLLLLGLGFDGGMSP